MIVLKEEKEKKEKTSFKERLKKEFEETKPYVPAIILFYILCAIIGTLIGTYMRPKPGVVDINGVFEKRTVDNPVTLCEVGKEEPPWF